MYICTYVHTDVYYSTGYTSQDAVDDAYVYTYV